MNPLHPPSDLNTEELMKTDPAAGLAVCIWENETFAHLDWYGPVKMDYPAKTLRIYVENPHADGYLDKTLKFEDFLTAAKKIINGETNLNKQTVRLVTLAVHAQELGQWDIMDMDCIAQVALFGEVVYG